MSRQDTKGDEMMTEERKQYTAKPGDELTQLRTENWNLRQQLDRQVAAWNGGTDALTAHATRQAQRIAELEATVQRLEADKRRMIAQIPYEDLRYIVNSHPNLRVDLRIEAKQWLDTVKVPHD